MTTNVRLRDRIHLLCIDPQNDFAHPGDTSHAQGALYVKGADADMERLAHFIKRVSSKLEDIHVTLDSHHKVHIANPIFWKNSKGDHPAPFTMITSKDVANGTWFTSQAGDSDRALKYLRALETGGRYPHVIWPPHCLIGSWGHAVYPCVYEAIDAWTDEFAVVDFVTKGSNPYTEHFSGVQAEVPDPKDPGSQLNTRLIDTLEKADVVVATGIAGSHCVANTITDIANNFHNADYIKKIVLLTDTISPVPGFEKHQADFIAAMTARGMQTSTTDKYLV